MSSVNRSFGSMRCPFTNSETSIVRQPPIDDAATSCIASLFNTCQAAVAARMKQEPGLLVSLGYYERGEHVVGPFAQALQSTAFFAALALKSGFKSSARQRKFFTRWSVIMLESCLL